ncbi:MAG: porin family protein [Smithellaceae bacterium]|nr:porin family protein [Smithellaceae bacterium]
MKRLSIAVILVVAILMAAPAYAQSGKWFAGIGGNFAAQDFKVTDLGPDETFQNQYHLDFGDTWGVSAKGGYRFTDWLALELDVDYLDSFKMKDQIMSVNLAPAGSPADWHDCPVSGKVRLVTVMPTVKLSLPTKIVRPFITVGAGGMLQGLNTEIIDPSTGVDIDETDYDGGTCAKAGVGIDFFVTDTVSIGVEGNYVVGFQNMDEMRYYNVTLGLTSYFDLETLLK